VIVAALAEVWLRIAIRMEPKNWAFRLQKAKYGWFDPANFGGSDKALTVFIHLVFFDVIVMAVAQVALLIIITKMLLPTLFVIFLLTSPYIVRFLYDMRKTIESMKCCANCRFGLGVGDTEHCGDEDCKDHSKWEPVNKENK
jgi:hypothetical protein